MPKCNLVRDREKECTDRLIDVIYGTGVNKRQYRALSQASGIPESTVKFWRKDPNKMNVGALRRLCKVVNATPEQVAGMFLEDDA